MTLDQYEQQQEKAEQTRRFNKRMGDLSRFRDQLIARSEWENCEKEKQRRKERGW